MADIYDVAIIGGGPGGYVAAIEASQLGKKVVLIEKSHIGGICLNWGCIPTKSLLKSAALLKSINHAQDFGINIIGKIDVDIAKMVEHSRSVSDQLTKGIKSLLKKHKIKVVDGIASITAEKLIKIESQGQQSQIKANNVIIATGARPKVISGFEPDNNFIWTYKDAMIPKILPKSLVIVGSGAIGIEFASFYNTLGVNVTVIEAQNRILPVEDEEISKIAKQMLEKQGIKIYTQAKLLKQSRSTQKSLILDVELQGKVNHFEAEKLLMAVGIVANTENLGLENTKIKLDKGHIITDKFTQTNESGIYAIGDVAGIPWLAHKASCEGVIAAKHLSNMQDIRTIDNMNVPSCVYSDPEIASVGLTESVAKNQGYKLKIGRFPFIGNGKALVLGKQQGLVKTIFDARTGELLGAHMIGEGVTELIHGYVITKVMEGTELDLMNTIFPHPTLSEMIHESVLQAYGKAIHI